MSHSVANLQKVEISLLGPASCTLPPDNHGQRQHQNDESQDAQLDKGVLDARVEPVARHKGENHGQRVVDDGNSHHALEDHIRVAVGKVSQTKIAGTAVAKANEAEADVGNGPAPTLGRSDTKEPHAGGEDDDAEKHEVQAKLGLLNTPVASAGPENKQVAQVASVETANDAANETRDVHVAHGDIAIVPGIVCPVVLLDGEIKGQGNVLHAPLQAGEPDSGKGKDAQRVPQTADILLGPDAAQVRGGGDEGNSLPVRLGARVVEGELVDVAGVGRGLFV